MNIILSFFIVLSLFCALSVILNINAIYSLFYLIATYVNVSIVLILFKFEFFAFIFIAIYAGAIAVLFLFILMTINLPIIHSSGFVSYDIIIISVLVSILVFFTNYLTNFCNISINFIYASFLLFHIPYTESLELISALLYTHYGIYVIIAAIILFFAMVGSISIFAEYQFHMDLQRYYHYIYLERHNNNTLKKK